MARKLIAPYGSWPSPLSASDLAAAKVRIGELRVVGEAIYWIESRPQEGGRSVIVRRGADGARKDLIPEGMGARTTVHEYGGGAYVVVDDCLYFCNFADQGIYVSSAGAPPRPVVVEEGLRFADLLADPRRSRLICVQEDHRGEGEPRNSLVSVPLAGSATIETLAAGDDFYASPRLSRDGGRLAWLSWRHPNLPWDGTDLWVADVDDAGRLAAARHVAGGTDESVFQPRWSPDGELWFSSDRSGYWNLYRERGGKPERVTALDADVGLPQWAFGMSVYDLDDHGVVFAACERGEWRLLRGRADGTSASLDVPYREIRDVHSEGGRVYFIGGAPDRATAVVSMSLDGGDFEILCETGSIEVEPGAFAQPEIVEVPTTDDARTYAFYYPPASAGYEGPDAERPPLIVLSHGGPTAAASVALNLEVQFWATRGFAVADVNYRGSTGFGRDYRRALDGRWGVVDVDDCCAVALVLAERGQVDRERLIIRGGSAGGYSTLAALAFRDVFAAGASYYGIGDLEALARDTHKFEARYLDRLIGPYPEERALYRERSPLHAAERLSCPVIFLQGLQDKVVPPNQAEAMVSALRAKGVPVAYVPFEGEQHGFRRAENICRALECELYFYSQVLGFEFLGVTPDLHIFGVSRPL